MLSQVKFTGQNKYFFSPIIKFRGGEKSGYADFCHAFTRHAVTSISICFKPVRRSPSLKLNGITSGSYQLYQVRNVNKTYLNLLYGGVLISTNKTYLIFKL